MGGRDQSERLVAISWNTWAQSPGARRLVSSALLWMHLAIRSMDQTTYPELAGPKDLPEAEALRDAARLPRPNAAANARAATPAE